MAENLHTIVVVEGSRKEHFRKGQGLGSGNGKTAGRGQKGQGAHAHTKKNGFEGGQMPLHRRPACDAPEDDRDVRRLLHSRLAPRLASPELPSEPRRARRLHHPLLHAAGAVLRHDQAHADARGSDVPALFALLSVAVRCPCPARP